MPSDNPLLLDACVLINLEATDRLDSLARTLGLDLLVPEPVCAEVGGLRAKVDGVCQIVPIRLDHHVSQGTLTVTALKPEELSTYVELARDLGDGEASVIAVAESRGLAIATDDRKARRISIEHGLPEPLRTTRILHDYCDRCDSSIIRDILWAVEQRANYIPARSDPDRDWWRKHLE